MSLDISRARVCLQGFDFKKLFVEEMGWDHHTQNLPITVEGETYSLSAVAEKRGLVVFICKLGESQKLPDYNTRRKIEKQVTRSVHEHILIFTDSSQKSQIWQWVKREPGKPIACREHSYHCNQPGESLLQKCQTIAFSFEEEENLTLPGVTGRTRAAFDVDRVTKKFYDRFKAEHDAFFKFLKGIPDEELQRWYVSVMLNRLMFIYFIQKKGFLDNDLHYLRNKLAESRKSGKDQFYSHFLCPLFFEGFAKTEGERTAAVNRLMGKVPYLNGGLFLRHQIEELHGKSIQIPDGAFEKLFAFFDQYNWHLDERPLRADNEINPDVLGYIFEKYVNQKQMGAYYTKEDITEYISKNTIIPFLFDSARKDYKPGFEGENSVWQLLQAEPDRYIYDSMKKGGNISLPPEISQGLNDVSKRTEWNKPAASEYALPTEIWREVVARRKRCEEVRGKMANAEIKDINDLITYNLDIRQFAQDAIINSDTPELLRAFWHGIEKITVLDPTCGSGAFLFAALNILEPLYEACLQRMESFVSDLERSGEKHRPEKFSDFRKVLQRVSQHPNPRYFILKSIIINNLFGVDIMEEATEICKLRLFLKMVAQVESVDDIEPLPDIDFNIRAGNTLVGFTSLDDVKRAMEGDMIKLLSLPSINENAEIADRAFQKFRQMQTEQGMDSKDFSEAKTELQTRLIKLEYELNQYLAKEYGIDLRKKSEYDKWLKYHEPFHWFIEFFGIIKKGGFDVIIGNPPYVELKEVVDYKMIGYVCKNAGNLYALVMERCHALSANYGRQGFIVPVSSISTDRYINLQNLITKNHLHYCSFDDRPSRLFDGLEHVRLTIHLLGKFPQNPKLFSSRYNKWNAIERPVLFETLRYVLVEDLQNNGTMPKYSFDLEKEIFKKLKSQNSHLSAYLSKRNSSPIYYSRKVGYFLQVLNFGPKVIDGKGNLRPPSEFKDLNFDNDSYALIALCCLNSNLFYWYITIFSDCRHVNKREIESFPVNLEEMASSNIKKSLTHLAISLMEDLKNKSEERRMKFKHDSLIVQCIIPKQSKTIIDKIDLILAKHYCFSEEELDFIINYDIKYRMGQDGNEEADD